MDPARIDNGDPARICCNMGETGMEAGWIRRQGSWFRLIAGWLCICVGLLGLLLPIVPGIPLLIFGLVLLSSQYHWAHRAMVWMKRRFHKVKG